LIDLSLQTVYFQRVQDKSLAEFPAGSVFTNKKPTEFTDKSQWIFILQQKEPCLWKNS